MASNLFNNLTQIFAPKQTTNAFKKQANGSTTFKICESDNLESEKTGLFDAIKKISGIEIENNVFNKLRTIAKLSDTGKTGTITGDGVKWVFDKMNYPLPDQLGSVVQNFNPQVVNSAIGAAKQIAQKAKQRDFKFSDIPEYVQDLSNFEALLGGIFVPNKVDTREVEACRAIDYAMDFAKDYGMKYKFLFVVQFVPNAGFAPLLQGINPAAFVKEFTPPQITIEHDEVNMYNYRTKVPKAVMFPNTSMALYDDGRNHVMTLIESYLKTISPIMRNENGFSLESNTFNFGGNQFSSSLKVLDDSSPYYDVQAAHELVRSILSEIRIYHVFLSGHFYNTYGFLNPRFTTVQVEPLSMESSDVSMVNIEFNYDSMYIEANRPFKSDKNNLQLQRSSVLNTGIVYKPNNINPDKPNNNDISNSADKIDGEYNHESNQELINQETVAIQNAITTLSKNINEDAKNASDAYDDADTFNEAAANAKEAGDMKSYKKYTELANSKTAEGDAYTNSKNNSISAAKSLDPNFITSSSTTSNISKPINETTG